jgi:hypothetical protein
VLPELLKQKLDPPATVITDAGADLVFCCEAQDLWVPHVAAALLDGRGDIAQVAARLHTRSDVSWSPLG